MLKKIFAPAVLTAAILGVASCSGTEELTPLPSASNEAKQVAEGGNEFAVKLYGQLKSRSGNLFFSPYSISAALAMANEGAAGATREQMTRTLGLPDSKTALAGMANLHLRLSATKGKSGFELSAANRLWPDSTLTMRPDYVKQVLDSFHVSVEPVDFSKPAAAAAKINAQVEKDTNERIKSLVTPDLLNNAKLVLTNAVYFKGDWDKQFKSESTREGVFFSDDGQMNAMMMHSKEHFGYASEEAKGGVPAFEALEMAYAGKELAMLVLLPKKGELGKLEAALSAKMLADVVGNLISEEVDVTFPKFKMEDSFDLKSSLQATGIVDAFDRSKADFSGISAQKELYIYAAVHKAFVEVNEKGTEAAAATAVAAAAKSAAPAAFKADHPFIFVLRDRGSGAILFMGRVVVPRT